MLWTKSPQGSVLLPQVMETSFPDEWVCDPCVIKDEKGYRIWYAGRRSCESEQTYIRNYGFWHATSPDGIKWTPYPQTAIFEKAFALGMSLGITLTSWKFSPFVIRNQEGYQMWYTGCDGANRRIFYAFSKDGHRWETSEDVGNLSLYYETSLSDPWLIQESDHYKMYFTQWLHTEKRIGIAISHDGMRWERHSNHQTAIDFGRNGEWDSGNVWCPSIIKGQNGYRMWYLGTDGGRVFLGSAHSNDGWHWTKNSSNPSICLGKLEDKEKESEWSATVIWDGGIHKLYYTYAESNCRGVKWATSPDGIHWKISPEPIRINGYHVETTRQVVSTTPLNLAPGRVFILPDEEDYGYRLWFAEFRDCDNAVNIQGALSKDGILWEKLPSDLALHGKGIIYPWWWEGLEISSPWVIQHNDSYHLWFSGSDIFGKTIGQIGYADSEDGLNWRRYPNNPVLKAGSTGSWDSKKVIEPCVIWDGNLRRYRMWYTGSDGRTRRIGHAVSADGKNWEKRPATPLLDLGHSGEWDEDDVWGACVIKQGRQFQMWYSGLSRLRSGIGYAVSSDGIRWKKHPSNPVLISDRMDKWDYPQISKPSVILERGSYRMWYMGFNWNTWGIGHATSPDGVVWEKYESNPALTPYQLKSWDSQDVQSPWVIKVKDSDGYKMWYAGVREGNQSQIGFAISEDGLCWKRWEDNPVFEPSSDGWDSYRVDLTRLIYHDSEYKMWYSGFDGFRWRIGYAVSEDGIAWKKHSEPILEGTEGSWDADGVWGASVIWDGQRYKMWYTGTSRTQAYISSKIDSSDVGYAISEDGIHWTKYATQPVVVDGDSPCVLLEGGLFRMWYGYAGRHGANRKNSIYYATSCDGVHWKLFPNNPIFPLVNVPNAEAYRPTVILAEDRYRMWYENGGGGHYKIEHAVSEATDIARISPIEYRIRSSESVGSRMHLTIEVSFKNFGPGKAQAAEATLIDTAENIASVSPSYPIQLGDIEANQTVCKVVKLKLNRPIPSDLADLNLQWRVEYTDTVMGDRHFYSLRS